MNLAGEYVKACHNTIHQTLLKSPGLQTLVNIEDHYNFAWKEKLANRNEMVVHYKGATTVHQRETRIIPVV
jgi:tRNA-splicing ligase RtcB